MASTVYTYHVIPKEPHLWVSEGTATFFWRKTDYSLHWHLLKLKALLASNHIFDLSDISKLKMDIPSGEHVSDLRYIIGGLLMRNIYEKEGIKGLIEALKYGTTDEDFYQLLYDKLEVTRTKFDEYIKLKMKKYTEQ